MDISDVRSVALTGGTGFLGYHLIPALLGAGYRVRLLKRQGSFHPLMQHYPEGVEPIEMDFRNVASIEQALRGSQAVIHGIGLVSYDLKDQKKMWDVHVLLTQRMLEAAKKAGIQRFVHVSSIVALGHGKKIRDESAVFNAQDLHLPYWDTKAEAERIALG